MFERQVGLDKKLFDSGDSRSGEFLVRRATKGRTEAAFQLAARKRSQRNEVTDVDAVTGVLPDEMADFRDIAVFDGFDLSRQPLSDALGWDETDAIDYNLPLHHAVEQAGGDVADFLRIGLHTGKRWITQRADGVVVIYANDTKVIRDPLAETLACPQDLLSTDVVAYKQPGWRFERRQPFLKSLAIDNSLSFNVAQRSRFTGGDSLVDGQRVLSFFYEPTELLQAVLGVVSVAISAKSEAAEAAFPKVIECETRHGVVVGFDLRDAS